MNKGDRIYKELIHEAAAIWYISDEYGSKVMVKIPTPSIKALIKGCKIEFLFGRDENQKPNIFHTGLKIYDDPLNYQMVFCTHRFLDEHLSITKIMNLDKVQIQLFNELNVCQAFGELMINEEDKHEILTLLGNPKKLYTGEFNNQLERSLDGFQASFMISSPVHAELLSLVTVEGQISNCKSMQNFFYHDSGITIDTDIGGNEGTELEKEVFSVLYSLFNRNTFRNPRILYKNNTRELTDILAFSEFGIFLVETKALGVINAEDNRTMERKVAGLQKQICKAVNQLVGGMKKIAENTPIYDTNSNEILFKKTIVPHGIILISEFFPFGKWTEIFLIVCEAMVESNSMIHVMDMIEFMQFVGYAQGDKDKFDYFLVQRVNNFVKNPTLFQRTIFTDKLPGDENGT
jgi:hypothetical protein